MANETWAFNVAFGKERTYLDLTGASDAIVAVLLKLEGLEEDETLRDYTNLAALLAGTSDECNFVNYARKVFSTGIVATTDNAVNRLLFTMAELTWTNAGSNSGGVNNNIAKLLFCYLPDIATPVDADTIPLTAHKWIATTDGSNLGTTALASVGPLLIRNL